MRKYSNAFSICRWNLNSISALNYAKVFLLKAYIVIHKFDVICISEIYLDSITPSNDSNLEISGYALVRSDHSSDNKRGGFVFITKYFYLYEFSMSNICKKVYVLNLKFLISLQIPKQKLRWLWSFYWKPWIKFRKHGTKESVLSCGNWRF